MFKYRCEEFHVLATIFHRLTGSSFQNQMAEKLFLLFDYVTTSKTGFERGC